MRFFDNPAGHSAAGFRIQVGATGPVPRLRPRQLPAWESPTVTGGLRDRAEAVTARHGPGLPRWSQYGHQDAIRVPD
jgi:hypothetical protein